MTTADDTLVQDARALLASFARQGAKRLQVRLRADASLTLSRDYAQTGTPLHAPHVGTVVSFTAPGAYVEEGDALVVISVLDHSLDLTAPASGIIDSIAVQPDELVEFGTVIAWIDSEDLA